MKPTKGQYPNTKPMELPDKYEAGFLKDLDNRTHVFQFLKTAYQEVMSDMGGSHLYRTITAVRGGTGKELRKEF